MFNIVSVEMTIRQQCQKEKISILKQFPEVPMYLYGAFVLCFTYSVIQYAYCGKVRISNLSTLTEVRISNLVYIYRVIR
jgi:hypothetical protein